VARVPTWRAEALLSELAAGYIDLDECLAAVTELGELWEVAVDVELEELLG
jgi:hypothetical protein